MKDWKTAGDHEMVCYCRGIDKITITRAIEEGAVSLKMIQDQTSACTGGNCREMNPSGRCCSADIAELLRLFTASEGPACCCCHS